MVAGKLAALSGLSVRTVQRVEQGDPSDLDTPRLGTGLRNRGSRRLQQAVRHPDRRRAERKRRPGPAFYLIFPLAIQSLMRATEAPDTDLYLCFGPQSENHHLPIDCCKNAATRIARREQATNT